MPSSLAKSRPATHLNSLAPRMAKASIDVNPQQLPVDFTGSDAAVSLVFAALADIGMSDKEAAYTMAMDPAQLSRAKSGQARLPIDALWRLPANFWLSFGARLNDAKKLTPESDRAIKAARIGELVRLILEVSA